MMINRAQKIDSVDVPCWAVQSEAVRFYQPHVFP